MNRFFSFAALQITLVAALLPSAAFSFDVVKTWTGGGNANFYNPPDWNGGTRPDSLPGTNTDSLLFDGTGIIPNPLVLNVNGTQSAYELKSWTFTAGSYTFGGTAGIQNVTLGDTTSTLTNTGILKNTGTGTITFNNTSVFSLRFGAIDAVAGPIVFGASPTLNIGFNLNDAVNNVTVKGVADVTVGSVIAGAGTDTSAGGVLIKEGTNTLFLNNNSAGWNGRVAINNGQVSISKASALGSSAGRTTIGGDASTGRLQISGSIGITEPLHLAGRASSNTSDHLRNLSGNNLLAGPITLDAGGTEYYLRSDAGTLAASGDLVFGPATGSSTLHLQGDGNGSLTGNVGIGGADLGILKEGAGTWTLSGSNSYGGVTTIQGGRLNITTAQTGKGATSLADGTTLGLTLAAAGQSFAPAALALGTATGGTIALDLGSFGANPIAPVINTGAVTINGTNTINIKAGGLSIGQFPLIRYTALGGTGVSGLALGSLPARVNASLVDDAAHSQVLLNVVLFDYPRWTGAQDGNWDIDDGTATGTTNWKEFSSGVVTRYLQSATNTDGVRFDDTAAGSSNVILTGTLTPASVKIVNDVLAYTFSGVGRLSGGGSLTKEGPGTLLLVNTGINDYAGTTTISAGTVQVGDGFQAGGGSLGAGPVINNATLVLNRPDNYTLAGAVSGTGSIVQSGPGVTTLSGTNTFSGQVTVAAGTLRLGNGNALGGIAAGTAVQAGGVIDLNGQLLPQGEVVSIGGDGIGGAGALINTGTGSSGVGLKNLVLTAPATIGGSTRWDIRDSDGGVNAHGFDLIKTGTNAVYWANLGETGIGNLNINGSASRLVFEGNTTLGGQPGIITVETSAQLGLENNTAINTKAIHLNTGAIRVTAGTTNAIASTISIDTVGTLDVGPVATELLLSGKLTGGGNLIKTSPGIVKIVGDSNDFAGVTQISAGSLWLGNDGPTGSLPATDIVDNATLTLRRTDTALNIASNISGTGAIVVGLATAGSVSSLVTLSGNNSFTGTVTVNRGGLRITNSNALGAGPKVVAVQSNQKPHLHLAAAGDDIVLDPGITFNTSSDDATLPGIINEAGNNVIGGTINLRNGSGGNTRIRVDTGSLALAGTVIAAPDATSARTLILDGVGTENRVDGVLANGVGNSSVTPVVAPQNLLLTKAGTGTWTLNAANTFTGATAIQQGVLKLGPVGSIAATASIDIAAGAALDASAPGLALASQTVTGSGALVGNITLGTASIVSPGTSTTTGTLSVAGSLIFGGGTLQANVSLPLLTSPATGDAVNITGDVAITAPSKIQVLPTGAILSGSYPLITYTGALTGDPATLSITNTTRAAVAVDTTTPGEINLVFSGGNASLVWSGNGTSSVWDSSTKANWNTGVEHFFQVDAVRFDDTAPADKTAITVT
ncbi:MAG: outer rane autotransporter barrel domain protein, partial [Verrucomicrobiaceae bacterium]|nr:outer rane autotransporter barrel domain protein [Verrucomicrobiaceae bacterium]